MIRLAGMTDLEDVLEITRNTISEIYPHYYADGVVSFFLEHHSRENILDDIKNNIVWLIETEDGLVGTVTIKENAIYRLFVLPGFQSRGIGSQLMDFAENKIAEKFGRVHIDSSLPAKEMYLKRRYKEKKTCKIQASNGDILIYDEMEKWFDKSRQFVVEVSELAQKYGLNYFVVTDGASGISNVDNPAVAHARKCHEEWEIENGIDPEHDWGGVSYNGWKDKADL